MLGRRGLVPFATPLPNIAFAPMRVSARVLLPRNYDIQFAEQIVSRKKSNLSKPLDLKLISQRFESPLTTTFCDSNGSFLFMNFNSRESPEEYLSTAVVFPDGALVTWYMRGEEEVELAAEILSVSSHSHDSPSDRESSASDQFDALDYVESIPVAASSVSTTSRLHDAETLTLTSNDENRSNEMLAVSMAVSAAVRLNVIESNLSDYIKSGQRDIESSVSKLNQWRLPQISASVFEAEKGVHRWRYLLSTIHRPGVPDSLWEYERLDQLFDEMVAHFDLPERYEDLQNQLTFYSDFLHTVGDYVRHGYSSRLEKIIILIIAIEAAIAMRHLIVEVA